MGVDLIPENSLFVTHFLKIFGENLWDNPTQVAMYQCAYREILEKIAKSTNAKLDFKFWREEILETQGVYFVQNMDIDTRLTFINLMLVLGYEIHSEISSVLLNRIHQTLKDFGIFNEAFPSKELRAFVKETLQKGKQIYEIDN